MLTHHQSSASSYWTTHLASESLRHLSGRQKSKQSSCSPIVSILTRQSAWQGADMAESAPEDRSNDSATFLLDLGLRSLAGGNAEAALDRLGACVQHLRSDGGGGEQLDAQLGAVLGSQVWTCLAFSAWT